jgi:hypothetical protein
LVPHLSGLRNRVGSALVMKKLLRYVRKSLLHSLLKNCFQILNQSLTGHPWGSDLSSPAAISSHHYFIHRSTIASYCLRDEVQTPYTSNSCVHQNHLHTLPTYKSLGSIPELLFISSEVGSKNLHFLQIPMSC